MRLSCVFVFPSGDKCGKPAFTRRSHGYLCIQHYREQQDAIPAKPRQPQPRWRGLTPKQETDEQVIADIIATDAKAIASGVVVYHKRGRVEPLVLRELIHA